MLLKILVDGKYNNAVHRAQKCKVGDPLTTSEAYGLSLIDSGYAEEAQPIVEKVATEKPNTAKPASNKPAKSGGSARNRSNPFKPDA